MIVIQHDLLLVDEEIASLIALVPFINTPIHESFMRV